MEWADMKSSGKYCGELLCLVSWPHSHEEGRISVRDLARVREKGREGALPQAKASHLPTLATKTF